LLHEACVTEMTHGWKKTGNRVFWKTEIRVRNRTWLLKEKKMH